MADYSISQETQSTQVPGVELPPIGSLSIRQKPPKDVKGLRMSSINVGPQSYLLQICGIALAGLFISLLVICSYYLWLGFQRFQQNLIQARYLTLILLGVQITSIVVTFIQVILLFCAFALQMCWKKFLNHDISSGREGAQKYSDKRCQNMTKKTYKALRTFKKSYYESFIGNQSQSIQTKSFGAADAETLRSWITPSLGWVGDYLRFKDIMRVYFYVSLVSILFSTGGFGIYMG
jgi:hypothetical protein